AIITFPNFGYWQVRSYLFFKGRMPVSKRLPYQWYDTPNIHLCTVRDFDAFCREHHSRVLERKVLNRHHQPNWATRCLPNFFGELALCPVTQAGKSFSPLAIKVSSKSLNTFSPPWVMKSKRKVNLMCPTRKKPASPLWKMPLSRLVTLANIRG